MNKIHGNQYSTKIYNVMPQRTLDGTSNLVTLKGNHKVRKKQRQSMTIAELTSNLM